MLFVYAWVLIEPHHHQAFAYLQMNLLYTYDAKNSLYNIVWNFQLPAITQRSILFLIVNYLKDLLSSNPTRSRLWAFDCSRSYKPLDLRKIDVLHCLVPSKPPWLLKRPQIDFSMHASCKESTPPEYFVQNIITYVISIKTTANSIQMDLSVEIM